MTEDLSLKATTSKGRIQGHHRRAAGGAHRAAGSSSPTALRADLLRAWRDGVHSRRTRIFGTPWRPACRLHRKLDPAPHLQLRTRYRRRVWLSSGTDDERAGVKVRHLPRTANGDHTKAALEIDVPARLAISVPGSVTVPKLMLAHEGNRRAR